MASSAAKSPTSPRQLSTIHGDFISLSEDKTSPSAALRQARPRATHTKQRSASPRRRQIDQGVHLHLSLTDSQMDKLTSSYVELEEREPQLRSDDGFDLYQWLFADLLGLTSFSSGSPRADHRRNPGLKPNSSRQEVVHVFHGDLHPTARSPGEDRPSAASGYNFEAKHRGQGQKMANNDYHAAGPWTTPTAQSRYGDRDRYRYNQSRSVSPSKSSPSVVRRPAPAPTLAERRGVFAPSPIQVEGIRYGDPPSPSRRPRSMQAVVTDGSSSIYSDEWDAHRAAANVSPLHIDRRRDSYDDDEQGIIHNVLQSYTEWKRLSELSGPDRLPQVAPGYQHNADPKEVATEARGRHLDVAPVAGSSNGRDVYSPFPAFTQEDDDPSARKGRKVMIGHNGWLEHTGKTPDKDKKPSPPKKHGFLDSLKKMAKEVVDATETRATRKAKEVERGRRTSRLKISLDPREQSLLYCEMEFILTSALDAYINTQFNAGRLDVDKYKKIVDSWQQKGRPKVVGFRFDLETQLDLVHLHIQEFKFYGDRAGVPAAIAGVLDMMKVDARAMRIRTFCQPDSVMAKQLLDSQGLLHMLGCSEPRQIQLAEVIQFFKTVLEREKHFNRQGHAQALPSPVSPGEGVSGVAEADLTEMSGSGGRGSHDQMSP